MDVVGYSKLLVNEQREVMQRINSSARRQFATEQLKSIRQRYARAQASDDTAEFALWRGGPA